MSLPVIVRPSESVDVDEWSIVTNRRELTEAVRRLLADIAPELLHDLEHTPMPDAPDGVHYNHLPCTVDELIDHIKEQQR